MTTVEQSRRDKAHAHQVRLHAATSNCELDRSNLWALLLRMQRSIDQALLDVGGTSDPQLVHVEQVMNQATTLRIRVDTYRDSADRAAHLRQERTG